MAMSTPVRALVIGFSLLFLSFFPPASQPAQAQYAETPQVFATVDGVASTATQIGRRLFVAGRFDQVGPPTGGAVVVDADGTPKLGAFPFIDGAVNEIVADGLGGWVVVGGFRQVAGQPFPSFARIRPDRTVDPCYRITVDGPSAASGLPTAASISLATSARSTGTVGWDWRPSTWPPASCRSWGSEFDPGVDSFTGLRRTLRDLSVSSTGVYVSGGGNGLSYPQSSLAGRLWGFAAGSGAQLFEKSAFVTAIAATSTRVYVGGYRQPVVWAVDPLTGADADLDGGPDISARGLAGDARHIATDRRFSAVPGRLFSDRQQSTADCSRGRRDGAALALASE